jgi:hypothetical protein
MTPLLFAFLLAPATEPALAIPHVSTPPDLDDFIAGRPREAEAVIAEFTQREPNDGMAATQPTAAYLSYDDHNLYVVFVCRDAEPSKIRARLTRREGIEDDDWVLVSLDTFNDNQRAYLFIVTPLGIQLDGITTEGQGDDISYDTLWRSEGRLTADGYVVWIAIPFKSLRFARSDGQTWGLALGRKIPRNNELSFWPQVTRRIEGFTQQFADAALTGVAPGRNVQLIPYGAFAAARFFDAAATVYDRTTEGRAGLDAKLVVREAMTVDLALNPDFSQVESDSPQVTVNQRFEVFFPEKRPFFIENAGLFQTPGELLFFSRRVADPQIGGRLTGKVGRWTIAALGTDDRAAGRRLGAADPRRDDRAGIAVARVQRELPRQSNIGVMVSRRDFADSSNCVGAIDTRLKLNANWVLTAQAVASDTTRLDGTKTSGPAFNGTLMRSSLNLFYGLFYMDRSPGFHTDLGFVPRTDIRDVNQFVSYRWRPTRSRIVAFGPNVYTGMNWNHDGQRQDWVVRFPFEIEMKGDTAVFVRHAEISERFRGVDFRQHENLVHAGTRWLKWLSVFGSFSNGTRPNFFPAPGVDPFIAPFTDASLNVVLKPQPRLRLEGTYLFSRLSRVFDNHITRGRVDYQFTRALSLRGIVDYKAVLANRSVVALDRTKRVAADVLVTYLVNPGTALYVGYTDQYENLAFRAADPRATTRAGAPTQSTGRQFFVKTSYLLRF